TGLQVLQPLRHTGTVDSVAFSPDGAHLTSRSGNEVRVWEIVTGRPLLQAKPTAGINERRSPDGRWLAVPDGNSVRLLDQSWTPDAVELASRLWATQSDLAWHAMQLQTARKDNDWYIALYHVNRLLEFRPGEATLLADRRALVAEAARDPKNTAALLAH